MNKIWAATSFGILTGIAIPARAEETPTPGMAASAEIVVTGERVKYGVKRTSSATKTDTDLKDIDRLSIRYTRQPYRNRESRRFTAWMEPERWSSWPLPR